MLPVGVKVTGRVADVPPVATLTARDHPLRTCPACGAALRPGAPWCTLCYADLRPAPGPGPSAAPPDPAPTAGPAWPCGTCGAANPLDLDTCGACGSGFLSALREQEGPLLELPGVGDLTRLGRPQRLALAGAAALGVALMTFLSGVVLG
jgi:ribosomal protein L40E